MISDTMYKSNNSSMVFKNTWPPPLPCGFSKTVFSRERLKPLDFFWYFLVSKQTSDVSMQHDVSVFFASTILNRLFNSCIKLYWYWINTSSNMKGWLSNWPPLPPQKKTMFKKLSLIRVSELSRRAFGVDLGNWPKYF